jgi:hypothetical protein
VGEGERRSVGTGLSQEDLVRHGVDLFEPAGEPDPDLDGAGRRQLQGIEQAFLAGSKTDVRGGGGAPAPFSLEEHDQVAARR